MLSFPHHGVHWWWTTTVLQTLKFYVNCTVLLLLFAYFHLGNVSNDKKFAWTSNIVIKFTFTYFNIRYHPKLL